MAAFYTLKSALFTHLPTDTYPPKHPSHKESVYLKGVESTVFGVWTTCFCGVTPEKSLSCKGVLRPPFRGVSTFVRAIRFWASCVTEHKQCFTKTFTITFNRFCSSKKSWRVIWISVCGKCLKFLSFNTHTLVFINPTIPLRGFELHFQ